MLESLSILFALLIAVPGLLIPLHVSTRMYRVLTDQQRPPAEKVFAGGTVVAMLLLMGIALYAAQETYSSLNALADSARQPAG